MYSIRVLRPAHLPALLALQAPVAAAMPADQFVPMTDAELASALAGGGVVHGAFDGDRLVGYQALVAFGDGAENLGHDLGLAGAALAATLHLEQTVIHPDARGQGLNDRLMARSRRWARRHGFTRLAATVSPFNVASLRSHLRGGFTVERLVRKYGGAWRYVLVRPLDGKPRQDHA